MRNFIFILSFLNYFKIVILSIDSTETGCGNPGLEGIDEFMRYHTGTKIEYNCSTGFEMIGNNISECQESRHWSSPKPECKGDNYIV